MFRWILKLSTMNKKNLSMKSGKDSLNERYLKAIDNFDLTIWLDNMNDRDL